MSLPLSLPLALAAAVLEARSAIRRLSISRLAIPSLGWAAGWLAGGEPQSRRGELRRAPGGGRPRALPLSRAGRACRLGCDAALPLRRGARLRRACLSRREPAGATQPRRPRERRSPTDSTRASTRAVARSRRSSAAIRMCWMRRALRARRSRAWRRIFPTALSLPSCGPRVGGLVGGALYKAINTADSMIGHRDERYKAFGWAAARLDDLVNLPASRLPRCGSFSPPLLTPGASARDAAQAVRRDAPRHRSPNAGWPEAAMAGALGLKLAGPRVYGETLVDDAFMGSGRREPTPPTSARRCGSISGRARSRPWRWPWRPVRGAYARDDYGRAAISEFVSSERNLPR